MKDDEYKGYYCLLIAILCNLNAAEASTMYETVHKKAQGNRTGSGYEGSS